MLDKTINEISDDVADLVGEPALEPGDVVCLKSGGPPMVIRVREPFAAICDWTDANGVPYQRLYLLEQLEAAQVDYVGRR